MRLVWCEEIHRHQTPTAVGHCEKESFLFPRGAGNLLSAGFGWGVARQQVERFFVVHDDTPHLLRCTDDGVARGAFGWDFQCRDAEPQGGQGETGRIAAGKQHAKFDVGKFVPGKPGKLDEPCRPQGTQGLGRISENDGAGMLFRRLKDETHILHAVDDEARGVLKRAHACGCLKKHHPATGFHGGMSRFYLGLEFLEGGQDLLGMSFDLDATPQASDDAFLVDDKGRTLDPHVLLAVIGLFDPDAV